MAAQNKGTHAGEGSPVDNMSVSLLQYRNIVRLRTEGELSARPRLDGHGGRVYAGSRPVDDGRR
jgi:hypothetical protein